MIGSRARRLVRAGILALALGAPLAASARPPGPPDDFVARHAERLGLDAATQAEIERIAAESEAREQELRERIRAARERLHELLAQEDVDRDAVMAQSAAVSALYAESHRNRLDAVLRIHEALSPEQRAALVAIRREERPWHGRGPLGRCSHDFRRLCEGQTDGPAALRCLGERWGDVSERCREALAECTREGPPPPR
jgi:Spy/CpxP family protein refolding chaperone